MNTNRVVQVFPKEKDEMVLFMTQAKRVKMQCISHWVVVETLDYSCKWERMTMNIRPAISDSLGFKIIDDNNIIAVRVKGSQEALKKKYAKRIQEIISKMNEF